MTAYPNLVRSPLLACAFALRGGAGGGRPASRAAQRRSGGPPAGGDAGLDVIVHGSRTTVDGLARQYNLTVRKYLREGAVLRITAGQLAALAADESQDHISPDSPPPLGR